MVAKGIVKVDTVRQYAIVWRYTTELKRVCTGNIIKINVGRPNRFNQDLVLSTFGLIAEKEVFIKGCKPFAGVDGFHLKTNYSGKLLIDVGRVQMTNIFNLHLEWFELKQKRVGDVFFTTVNRRY